jgi:hypothetical protein
MKFITIRSLRNRPGSVTTLVHEDDLVLTSNGNPIAILVGIRGDFEEALLIVRQARARCALSRLRRVAASRSVRRTA